MNLYFFWHGSAVSLLAKASSIDFSNTGQMFIKENVSWCDEKCFLGLGIPYYLRAQNEPSFSGCF